MNEDHLEEVRRENEILRQAVISYILREKHVAEILKGVTRCDACRTFLTVVADDVPPPCDLYLDHTERINPSHQLLADKVNG